MRNYTFSKNLEREPLVYGLLPKFFYMYLALIVGGLIFWAMLLLSMFSGGTLASFFIYSFIWIFSLVMFSSRFKKISKQEKYKFNKKRSVLSNKDLFDSI